MHPSVKVSRQILVLSTELFLVAIYSNEKLVQPSIFMFLPRPCNFSQPNVLTVLMTGSEEWSDALKRSFPLEGQKSNANCLLRVSGGVGIDGCAFWTKVNSAV